MADNVPLNPGSGGPLVAADEVSYSGDTANVQLVRVVTVSGAEGSKTVGASDALSFLSRIPANGQAAMAASMPVSIASDQTPVPVQPSLGTASGSITTQNAAPNGVATAGSAVEIVLNGAASMSVQTTGVYTGALSVQVTSDGTRWETITGAIIVNALSGVGAATIASAAVGIFTVPVHGALRARVTGLSAMTGAAAVTLRALATPTVVYAFQPTAANLAVTASGTVTANIGTGSLAAGTNLIGDVSMQVRANATGAMTGHHIVTTASTNVAQIKATAGRVYGWCLSNTTASWRYVKLHNVASATAGSGVVQTIGIPPNDKAVCSFPHGIAFSTAISRSVVTGAADTDATATAANDVVGDIFFA